MRETNKKPDYKAKYQRRKERQSEAKNLNKYGIVVGETYGNYKVLEKVKVPHRVSRGNGIYVDCMATKWKCQYVPTGEIKIVPTAYVSEFKTQRQMEEELDRLVKENKHQIGFRNQLYRTYKTNSQKRGHEFLLTQEEFESIIFQNCHYCGESPRPMTESQMIGHGNPNQPPLCYNGIDRLDSTKDYTIDNVVPCCPRCNYMKHILNYDEFLSHIKKIYNNLNLGSTTIPKGSTPQANGGGNGELLTGNAEDEDIV